MNKFKAFALDVLFLVYVLVWAFFLMWFTAVKDNLPSSTSIKNVFINMFHLWNYEDIIQPEMIPMPGSYNFDPNSIIGMSSKTEEIKPEEFEWTISEEYDNIKLQKGWTLNSYDYHQHWLPMNVTSVDPYANGGNGVGCDEVKARYNQTCAMNGVPYGTLIWLRGSGTNNVFVVTDRTDANDKVVLHQHDKLGTLDGQYEVVRCSPPTTHYLPDTPSTKDFEAMYQEWKEESREEARAYYNWLDQNKKA